VELNAIRPEAPGFSEPMPLLSMITNEEIAASWELWRRFYDLDGEMTEAQFLAMPMAERLQLLDEVFKGDSRF